MFVIKQSSGSPEQVFASVRNASATTLSMGHGVVWYFRAATGSRTNFSGDGYSVSYATTVTDVYDSPRKVAGIVAGHNIEAESFGSIQQFGYTSFFAVTGSTAASATGTPFMSSWAGATTTQDEVIQNWIFRPRGVYGGGTTEGANSTAGYWGLQDLGTAGAVQQGTTWNKLREAGGYIEAIDGFYSYTVADYVSVYSTNVTLETNAATICSRGWVRCL